MPVVIADAAVIKARTLKKDKMLFMETDKELLTTKNTKKMTSEILLVISFTIFTISNSKAIISLGLTEIFEYISYLLLLTQLFLKFLINKNKTLQQLVRQFLFAFLVFSLMSIGILVNNLPLRKMFLQLMIVATITICSVLGDSFINSLRLIKLSSIGILIGLCVSFILAVAFNISVVSVGDPTLEGVFGMSFALSGPMQYRNVFSMELFAVFVGLSTVYCCSSVRKTRELCSLILLAVAIFFSNSRGVLILMALYLVTLNISKIIKFIRKNKLIAAVLCIALIIFGLFLYYSIATSINYGYRLIGLSNAFHFLFMDRFNLLFGASRILFSEGSNYLTIFRELTNYGMPDMALVNILIKYGLFGFLGFSAIFIKYLYFAINLKSCTIKNSIISIVIIMLVSSLVYVDIQSVHMVFGIYCYLILAGLYGMSNISLNCYGYAKKKAVVAE
jgi:hypothetical protein